MSETYAKILQDSSGNSILPYTRSSLDKTYGTTIGYIRVNSFSTYESSLEYDYTGSGWNTIGGLTTNVDYSITGGQWLII